MEVHNGTKKYPEQSEDLKVEILHLEFIKSCDDLVVS